MTKKYDGLKFIEKNMIGKDNPAQKEIQNQYMTISSERAEIASKTNELEKGLTVVNDNISQIDKATKEINEKK